VTHDEERLSGRVLFHPAPLVHNPHQIENISMSINRRGFLLGSASAALAPSFALQAKAQLQPSRRSLSIVTRTLDVNGRAATVFGLLQPDGTQGLSFAQGDLFDVQLHNRLSEPSIIHWHGLTPPWRDDGVADVPEPLLSPAASRTYAFPVGDAGTHWMHAHTLQEQNLLAAPLIVRDKETNARDEQEVVLLVHDFSFTPAAELFAKLAGPRGGAHGAHSGHAMAGPAPMQGHAGGHGHGAGHGAGMDLNDIEYDAYLANDRTLADPQVVRVEKSGRVRLRIINGATATAFTIDTGAIEATAVAVDGQPVQAVKGRRFPMTMGQRLDLLLALPAGEGSYPIFALREGALERTGIVLATPSAVVTRFAERGTSRGPVLDLSFESRLRALTPLPSRTIDRSFSVTLTGTMAGYQWGIAGGDALRVRRGERVAIAMSNRSMMAHPMHLHGHRFQVIGIGSRRVDGPVRDTVLVPPMGEVTIAFDATNPGRWAFHCHHLYHMAAGMMSFVAYEGVA